MVIYTFDIACILLSIKVNLSLFGAISLFKKLYFHCVDDNFSFQCGPINGKSVCVFHMKYTLDYCAKFGSSMI